MGHYNLCLPSHHGSNTRRRFRFYYKEKGDGISLNVKLAMALRRLLFTVLLVLAFHFLGQVVFDFAIHCAHDGWGKRFFNDKSENDYKRQIVFVQQLHTMVGEVYMTTSRRDGMGSVKVTVRDALLTWMYPKETLIFAISHASCVFFLFELDDQTILLSVAF
jgi:hypothetical protein